ncbi:MAG: hypothetical protein P4M02_01645, partial [Clostridia bacterium]|nr:hypothetical protein [Clostridia bacterium]
MKPIITRSSVKSFLLADQTKFYKHSPYIIYTLGEFTAVITDKALTAEEKQCLDKIGANMIQA